MDLRTNQRAASFPSDKLSPPPDPAAALARGQSSRPRARQYSLSALLDETVLDKKGEAARIEQERRRRLRQAAEEAAAQTRNARREALRTSPVCAVDLMHAAMALDINLREQPELAFLAELALCVGLPAGWEPMPAEKGSPTCYRHCVSCVTITKHPLAVYAASFSFTARSC